MTFLFHPSVSHSLVHGHYAQGRPGREVHRGVDHGGIHPVVLPVVPCGPKGAGGLPGSCGPHVRGEAATARMKKAKRG